MIESLDHILTSQPLAADVCIVGSGAAGISIALQMASKGHSVLLIESGGESPTPATESFNVGENVGTIALRLTQTRTRALGGATRLWYGQCITLDPIDYRLRSWVPNSGWPIQSAALEPFYRKAERFFQIPQDTYDERIYRQFGLTPPAFERSVFEFKPTIYTPLIDFHKHFRASLEGSKSIRVVCDATATRIRLNDARTRVDCVDVQSLHGATRRVTANAYVIACGGIENARLLLASDVGNDSDMVGRFLQDHLTGDVAELKPDGAASLQDVFGLLYRDKIRYFPKFHLSAAAQEKHRVLNATMHMRFEYGASGVESMRRFVRAVRRGQLPPDALNEGLRVLRNLPAAARVAYRRYGRGLSPDIKPDRILFQVHSEQTPNPESRVTLSDRRDTLGQPLARVDWRLGPLEQRTFQTMYALIEAQVAKQRLGTLTPRAWIHESDWTSHVQDTSHPTGSTRMATSPAHGVVDTNCQVFGIEGLYVAGSSVFPTNGYANPTLTIVALALRLSEHLSQRALHRPAANRAAANAYATA